ncbi:MAG: hypothetical protein ACP5T0_03090 [Verrucomicrobiia bacterium]
MIQNINYKDLIFMWKFREILKGTPEKHSHEDEFFKHENLSEALVREIIQNSLDARSEGEERVKVSFKLGTVSWDSIQNLLFGLIPHLESVGLWKNQQNMRFENNDDINYLLIEDYGTTGLNGSISRTKKDSSNFYDFWWREGLSSKKGSKGGKWGLGKNTIHMSSDIRTFFGLTIREDDKKEILMGKALLEPHEIDNVIYIESGYYCDGDFDPIYDRNIIESFKKTFQLNRKDETGLSLVIPFSDSELNYENIILSVLKHFFYPILQGNLVVEIQYNSNNSSRNYLELKGLLDNNKLMINRECLLNNDNINKLSVYTNAPDIIDYLTFAQSTLNKVCTNVLCNKDYIIDTQSFDQPLDKIIEEYYKGDIIGFKIKFGIKDKNGQENPTYVNVYLKRSEKYNPELFWFRSGIRIIEIKNNVKNYPVLGLFNAEDKPISEFLSSAETPAHTDWNERAEDLKNKYKNYKESLRFIKNIFRNLLSIIDKPPENIQYDALKHIFSLFKDGGKDEYIHGGNKSKIPVLSDEKIINIYEINSGFKANFSKKFKEGERPKYFKATIDIQVAYDCIRGNPFAKYDIYDFDFSKEGNINIKVENGEIQRKDKNRIIINTNSPGFSLEVTGFDIKRDIVINVETMIEKLEIIDTIKV